VDPEDDEEDGALRGFEERQSFDFPVIIPPLPPFFSIDLCTNAMDVVISCGILTFRFVPRKA
jgi:hypothetical protein